MAVLLLQSSYHEDSVNHLPKLKSVQNAIEKKKKTIKAKNKRRIRSWEKKLRKEITVIEDELKNEISGTVKELELEPISSSLKLDE